LPAGASDVSYCTTSRGSERIEFSIDEPAFRQWVADVVTDIRRADKGEVSPLAELTEPVRVDRYLGFVRSSNRSNEASRIEVQTGLSYRWSHTDHRVSAVYDRSARRAYLSVDWY
jgi:hypothetical protein